MVTVGHRQYSTLSSVNSLCGIEYTINILVILFLMWLES
jgi:hypothetical protein